MTQFQRGIWSESVDAFRKNIDAVAYYLIIMFVIRAVSEHLRQTTGLFIAEALAAAYLAIPIHRTVLLKNAGWKQMSQPEIAKRVSPFFIRSIGLSFLTLIPALVVMVLLAIVFSNPNNVAFLYLSVIAAGFVFAISIPFIFAKWGTMLPAAALGGDAGLSRAGARGSTTFFYALPRLFISIILLGGVFGGLNYYAATHYGPRLFSLSGALISNQGVPNFSKILYWSATKLYGTFQLVMTAVILSRAYMIVEGEQSTPVSTTRTDKFIRPQTSGGDFKPLFPGR